MNKYLALLSKLVAGIVILVSTKSYSEEQSSPRTVAAGKLITHLNLESEYVQSRPVHVWLPDGYSTESKYDVLYMHDGQMLFDPTTTWNKKEWGVDEVSSKLMKSSKVKPFIVVAIENIKEVRFNEYFPQKSLAFLPENGPPSQKEIQSANFLADNYLKYLVNEVKPFIDQTYSVNTGRDSTKIAGSSMGGLISMYAISEYPNVFGGAACISTHWVGARVQDKDYLSEAIFQYMKASLPKAGNHKLYFDFGDQTLDQHYPPLQAKADKIIKAKNYNSTDWITRFYKGHAHDEDAWRQRLDVPLTFLFTKSNL